MRYIPNHSRTISASAIKDLSLTENKFEEGISHLQALLPLFRTVHKKINGNIPLDQAAQLADPVRAIVRRVFLDDEEIEITFRCIISPGNTSEKDDFFGFVFCDDLGTDILNFLLNIHGVLDLGAVL